MSVGIGLQLYGVVDLLAVVVVEIKDRGEDGLFYGFVMIVFGYANDGVSVPGIVGHKADRCVEGLLQVCRKPRAWTALSLTTIVL